MAITFVAAGAASQANDTTITPALPAGWQDGDLGIIWVSSFQGGTSGIDLATGWTDVPGVGWTDWSPTGSQISIRPQYRVLQTGDSAPTFGATQGPAGWIQGCIMAFRGVDQSTPFDVNATKDNTINSSTMTAPTLTTVSADVMSIRAYASNENNIHNTNSEGTLAFSGSSYSFGSGALSAAYLLEGAAGAIGTATMSQSQDGPSETHAVTMALRPAAGAGGAPLLGGLLAGGRATNSLIS